jgi:hypothetical protein
LPWGERLSEFEEISMPGEKHDGSGFKVVDRRPFSGDGKVREKEHDTAKHSEPPPQPEPAAAAPSPLDDAPQDTFESGAGGFKNVVQFLGTTALFQLGLMQGPSGEAIPTDLVSARHTIDMLETLEVKTRGNLTREESQLLEDVLYELRMSFVEVEKRLAKRSK